MYLLCHMSIDLKTSFQSFECLCLVIWLDFLFLITKRFCQSVLIKLNHSGLFFVHRKVFYLNCISKQSSLLWDNNSVLITFFTTLLIEWHCCIPHSHSTPWCCQLTTLVTGLKHEFWGRCTLYYTSVLIFYEMNGWSLAITAW